MDILGRIKQLRDQRGWSNYKLAREANISEGSLNNLFRLGNKPTISTLEALCDAFGITLSQFFAGDYKTIEVNDEQLELLNMWNRLDREQQKALMELLKRM